MPPRSSRSLGRYLDEHPSALVRFAEAVCKALNALQLLAGLGLVAAAIWVLVASEPGGAEQAWEAAEKELLAVAAPLPVAALGLTGLASMVTASCGMAGASLRRLGLLNASVVLLPLLLAVELCFTVWSCVGDAPAAEDKGPRAQVHNVLLALKWPLLAVVGTQVLALASTCLLQTAYTSAEDAAEDDEDDELLGGSGSRRDPLLRGDQEAGGRGGSGRVSIPPRVQRSDSWSERMRTQYGLDTSRLGYDPTAASRRSGGAAATGQPAAAAATAADRSSSSSMCVVT